MAYGASMEANLTLKLTVVCCLLSTLCHAETSQPRYRAEGRRLGVSLFADAAGDLHASFRGPFAARERIKFRKVNTDPSSGVKATLVGIRRRGTHTHPQTSATLSILQESALLFLTTYRKGRSIAVQLDGPMEGGFHSLSRSSISRGHSGQHLPCGAIPDHAESAVGGEPSPRSATNSREITSEPNPTVLAYREVEMGIFFDSTVTRAIAEPAAEYLSATIFAANELYLQQAGVRVRVRRLEPLALDQLSSSLLYPERLLETFRERINPILPAADLFHLFTASELDDATAGIAYVGTACTNQGRYAVGLSRIVHKALQPIVFSHEVLHGLGVQHDNAPGSLMDPVLTSRNSRISRQTRAAISRFLKGPGKCITPPPPLRTSLTAHLTPTQFSAAISIRPPPPFPCNLLLQGRSRTISSSTTTLHRTARWRTIHKAHLPALSTDRMTLRYGAPAPVITSESEKTHEIRAALRCGDLTTQTRTQSLTHHKATAISANPTETSDWIDQLAGSIHTDIQPY